MTTGPSDRFDRIEALVESNAQAIAKASEERQELTELFRVTIQAIADSAQRQEVNNAATLQAIHAMQTQMIELQAEVREIQAEVRGLQVENRRIIDRVFGGES